MAPKYSQPEIERRWLVRDMPSALPSSPRIIEDTYIRGGRLRLRAVFADGAVPTYKLGKKYAREGTNPEQVVSIYLTEAEYESLRSLPGATLRKARYRLADGFLDVLEDARHGPAIFEKEFPSESVAASYVPPAFVGDEITFDPRFTGHTLAQRNA